MHRNAIGIVFALFAGLCTAVPSFVAPLVLGDQYKGVLFISDNDENTYRARIEEVLDGHIRVASPNLYENKDASGVIPPIYEYFYAIPALIFGLSVVIIFSKFALPALLFFMVYLLVVRVGGGGGRSDPAILRWTAVASGLFTILGFEALNFRQLLVHAGGASQSYQSVLWTRLVNPIVGALVLFTFLLCLWAVFRGPNRTAVIVAGGAMALSVGYFFSFGIIACTLLFSIFVFLLVRDIERLRRASAIFGIGVFFSLPYWIEAFGSIGGVGGRLLAERNGMFYTRAPVLNKLLFVVSMFVLLSFCYAYFAKRSREHLLAWQFLFVVLSGCWIALNEQIITGRTIWYYHFAQYTVPLGFIISFLVLYLVWRKEFPRLYGVAIRVLVGCSIAVLTLISCSFWYQMDAFKLSQRHGELFSYLNAHAEKDCVVLIKEESDPVEQMIPAYTYCNVYSTTYAFNGVPRERVLHNFLLRMRLAGVTTADMHEYLLAHQYEVRNYFFDNWTEVFGAGVDPWLLGRISMIEGAYPEFAQGNLYGQLVKYRIDFIASKQTLPEQILLQLPGLRLVATTSEYYLYGISPE